MIILTLEAKDQYSGLQATAYQPLPYSNEFHGEPRGGKWLYIRGPWHTRWTSSLHNNMASHTATAVEYNRTNRSGGELVWWWSWRRGFPTPGYNSLVRYAATTRENRGTHRDRWALVWEWSWGLRFPKTELRDINLHWNVFCFVFPSYLYVCVDCPSIPTSPNCPSHIEFVLAQSKRWVNWHTVFS